MKKSIFNWYSFAALLSFILGVVLIYLSVKIKVLIYVGITLFVSSFLIVSLNFYLIYLQNKQEHEQKRKDFVKVIIATRGDAFVPSYYPQFEAEDKSFKRKNAKYLIIAIVFLFLAFNALSFFI